MTTDEINELIERVEENYDETFDEKRHARWHSAFADQDAAAMNRAWDRWLENLDDYRARKIPTPLQLVALAPVPAVSSTTASRPASGIRQGVVKDAAGEIVGAWVLDGGWWLKPVDQLTDRDMDVLTDGRWSMTPVAEKGEAA